MKSENVIKNQRDDDDDDNDDFIYLKEWKEQNEKNKGQQKYRQWILFVLCFNLNI